jgi:hypothetical protein
MTCEVVKSQMRKQYPSNEPEESVSRPCAPIFPLQHIPANLEVELPRRWASPVAAALGRLIDQRRNYPLLPLTAIPLAGVESASAYALSQLRP